MFPTHWLHWGTYEKESAIGLKPQEMLGEVNQLLITFVVVFLFFLAKADEALKAKERSEEEAKKRKEEGNAFFFLIG